MSLTQSTTIFARVAASLASTFAQEQVDNPYAKAALAPLAETVVMTILGNLPLAPLSPGNPLFTPLPEDFVKSCTEQFLNQNTQTGVEK